MQSESPKSSSQRVPLIFPRVQFKGRVSAGQMDAREDRACQKSLLSLPLKLSFTLDHLPSQYCQYNPLYPRFSSTCSDCNPYHWLLHFPGIRTGFDPGKGFSLRSQYRDTKTESDLWELPNTNVPLSINSSERYKCEKKEIVLCKEEKDRVRDRYKDMTVAKLVEIRGSRSLKSNWLVYCKGDKMDLPAKTRLYKLRSDSEVPLVPDRSIATIPTGFWHQSQILQQRISYYPLLKVDQYFKFLFFLLSACQYDISFICNFTVCKSHRAEIEGWCSREQVREA